MTVFRNVAVVRDPAVTVTVAVPVGRLLLTSAPAGATVTDVSVVPLGKVSVITVGPGATVSTGLHEPAATVTGVPPTLNTKFVPTATPVPAVLQTCKVPVTGLTVFRNVAVVCDPAVTVTVAVPVGRLLLTSDPAGTTVTDVSVVPLGRVSVITVGPGATVARDCTNRPLR